MQPRVQIELGTATTVATSPPDVAMWGPYPFPMLSRLPDGRIEISFHVEADSVSSYGRPRARAVSSDGGQSWRLLPRGAKGGLGHRVAVFGLGATFGGR